MSETKLTWLDLTWLDFYCIESIVGIPDYKANKQNLLNVNGFVKNVAEVFIKIIWTAFVIDVFKQCNLKIKNKQTTCRHSDL